MRSLLRQFNKILFKKEQPVRTIVEVIKGIFVQGGLKSDM